MLQGILPSHRRFLSRQGSHACFARWRFCEGGLVSPLPLVEDSAMLQVFDVYRRSVRSHNTMGQVHVECIEGRCSNCRWFGWTAGVSSALLSSSTGVPQMEGARGEEAARRRPRLLSRLVIRDPPLLSTNCILLLGTTFPILCRQNNYSFYLETISLFIITVCKTEHSTFLS